MVLNALQLSCIFYIPCHQCGSLCIWRSLCTLPVLNMFLSPWQVKGNLYIGIVWSTNICSCVFGLVSFFLEPLYSNIACLRAHKFCFSLVIARFEFLLGRCYCSLPLAWFYSVRSRKFLLRPSVVLIGYPEEPLGQVFVHGKDRWPVSALGSTFWQCPFNRVCSIHGWSPWPWPFPWPISSLLFYDRFHLGIREYWPLLDPFLPLAFLLWLWYRLLGTVPVSSSGQIWPAYSRERMSHCLHVFCCPSLKSLSNSLSVRWKLFSVDLHR